ncbi:MAG: class I SAM-dependent methyltransferase [Deltaproteobacteria bacterium]|nr:class I SAM-dependent methyltransferase [Deltaproteobacteria bacterium]
MFEKYVDAHHDTKRKIVKKINQSTMTFTQQQKTLFCKKLIRKIEKIRISTSNDWKKYYKKQDIEHDVSADLKIQTIDKICQKIKFQSALDIGCNIGRFSIIAEKYAETVIAIDSSEDCIESVYTYANKHQKNILPLVVDYANPPGAYGFANQTFDAFFSRISADLVLFLGIMHHIHITCRQSFQTMIEHLASITKKYMIFEFVSADDKNNMLISNGRDINYSRDTVLTELYKYFDVDTVPSDRSTREMFICTKK